MKTLGASAALALILVCTSVCADVLTALNYARQHGCGDATVNKLQLNNKLNRAAKGYAKGLKPNEAIRETGIAMTQLASLHLEGFNDENELKSLLIQQSCKTIGDDEARDVGYFQNGQEVWILIGAERGNPGDPVVAAKRALKLVNDVRAQSRRCGDETYAATTPLTLNSLLTRAAQAHADEMARLRYVEHEGKDGSTPASRIAVTGYKWKLVGENVAAGEGAVDLLIDDWLGSPHHCANIMNPRFSEMGLAYSVNKDDEQFGVYWTQTLGAPQTIKRR